MFKKKKKNNKLLHVSFFPSSHVVSQMTENFKKDKLQPASSTGRVWGYWEQTMETFPA